MTVHSLIARLTLVAAAVATVALLLLLSPIDPDGRAASERSGSSSAVTAKAHPARSHWHPGPGAAIVSWQRDTPSRVIPRSFLGFSTEYWALPLFAPQLRLLGRALSLVHTPGDAPQILRIGGDSADRTFWAPRARRMPPWAFRLGPSWVRDAGLLVRHGHLRLILDLNLVTGSSPLAARWARAAERYLPRHSIVGFEVGNEPDIYDRWNWLQKIGRPAPGSPLLPRRLSAASYLSSFRSYARALARVAPDVPLVGPALARPALGLNWLAGLITGGHPGLGLISAHRYPYTACAKHRARGYPSFARVLSENASAGVAHSVGPLVRLADHAGLRFRMTELNSVSCGGVQGISDTFVTSLWAPDTLFELLKKGVDGANVHVRARAVNAAFVLDSAGLHARPLMYGLMLFARTIAPGALLVPLHLAAAPSLHLKAWGVLLPNHVLRVLLIDKGPRPVRVTLRLPGYATVSMQRLLAPAAGSRTGITLAGQQLDTAGRWRGAFVTQPVLRGRGGYQLTVPQLSASLLSATGYAQSRYGR